MKKSILTVLCIFTSMASASVENKKFNAKGLESLKLKITSGDVKVTVSEDGKAYVSANKVKFEKGCTLKINRSGKDLVVDVEKKGWFNYDNCKVHFAIKVPKATALNLKSGAGDLEVNGTKGSIDFSLGSGDVKVNAEVNELDGKSGSGSIQIAGLTGDADLKTGSGDMSLSYKSAPKKGELDIKAGSGDVTIFFPSAVKVLTSFKSGSGRLYNEFGDSADASFKISMKAGSGDLKIKKLQ